MLVDFPGPFQLHYLWAMWSGAILNGATKRRKGFSMNMTKEKLQAALAQRDDRIVQLITEVERIRTINVSLAQAVNIAEAKIEVFAQAIELAKSAQATFKIMAEAFGLYQRGN